MPAEPIEVTEAHEPVQMDVPDADTFGPEQSITVILTETVLLHPLTASVTV